MLDPRQKPANASDLGGVAGRHHQPARCALGDQCAGPQHRPAVAKGGIGGNCGLALFHRHRLAGQDRLLRRKAPRLEHPQIGRHLVTRLQKNNVTGNKVRAVHGNPPPIAQHRGLWCKHAPDRGHCRLGLAFLDEADHRVSQYDCQDHAGIHQVLQGPGHHRSADQDVDQHIVELPQEADHRPARPHLWQAVRPMRVQPQRSLGGGQAARRCGKTGKAIGGGGGMRIGDVHHRAV